MNDRELTRRVRLFYRAIGRALPALREVDKLYRAMMKPRPAKAVSRAK